jgi:hypothetical protein
MPLLPPVAQKYSWHPLLRSLGPELPEDINNSDNEYFQVQFDSGFGWGEGEDRFNLWENYLTGVNHIVKNDHGADFSENLNSTSGFTLNRVKASEDINIYNNLYSVVKNNMERNTNWLQNVPSVRRDQTIKYWTNRLFSAQKHVNEMIPMDQVSDEAKDALNDWTNQYFGAMESLIYDTSVAEYNQFRDAKFKHGHALSEGFVQFKSGIAEGLPALLDKDFVSPVWHNWTEGIKKEAEQLSRTRAGGIYEMTTEDVWNSDNTDAWDVLATVWSHAVTSAPQQIPSAVSSVIALSSKSSPAGWALSGLGMIGALGTGHVQEAGGFSQDMQSEYNTLRSNAINDKIAVNKGEMPEKDFRSLYGLQNGKTADELNDEEILDMSRSLARNYSNYATGLEVLNTVGDIALGRHIALARQAMGQAPEIAAKSFFKAFWKKPFIKDISLESTGEGLTELLQETVSEYKKHTALPDYDMSTIQILESGAIGAGYGASFGGIHQLIDRPDTPKPSSAEAQARVSERLDKFRHKEVDDAIIVGLHVSPATWMEDVGREYDMSIEEVEARAAELNLNQIDISRKSAARRYKNSKKDLFSVFPVTQEEGYESPFKKKDLKSDGLDFLDPDYDPTMDVDNPDHSSGLDESLYSEIQIYKHERLQFEEELRVINEALKNPDPNVPGNTRPELEAAKADLLKRIDSLNKIISGGAIGNKKRRANNVKKKAKKSDSAGVVGERVTLKTPKLNNTKGEIIAIDKKNPNLLHVQTARGIKKILASNVVFKNETDAIKAWRKKSKKDKKKSGDNYQLKNNLITALKESGLDDSVFSKASVDELIAIGKELPKDKRSPRLQAILGKKVTKRKAPSKPGLSKDEKEDLKLLKAELKNVEGELSKPNIKKKRKKALENSKKLILDGIEKLEGKAPTPSPVTNINPETGKPFTRVTGIIDAFVHTTDPEEEARETDLNTLHGIKDKPGIPKENRDIYNRVFDERMEELTGETEEAPVQDDDGAVKRYEKMSSFNLTLEDVKADYKDIYKKELEKGEITQEEVDRMAKGHYEEVQEELKVYKENPLKYLENELESWSFYQEKNKDEDYSSNIEIVKNAIAELKKTKTALPAEDVPGNAVELDKDYIKKAMAKAGKGKKRGKKGKKGKGNLRPDEKGNIANNTTGGVLGSLLEDTDRNDSKVSMSEEGEVTHLITGKAKKKVDRFFEATWAHVKKAKGLTDMQFRSYFDEMQPYFDKTPFGINFRQWGEHKIAGGVGQYVSEVIGTIRRAGGNLMGIGEYNAINAVLQEDFYDAIEFAEGLNVLESEIEQGGMDVKSYSKIAKTFFQKYAFNITPTKLRYMWKTAEQYANDSRYTPSQSYIRWLDGISSHEFLANDRGESVSEFISRNQRGREFLKRFWVSIHPDNVGTANKGKKGEIVEWEAAYHPPISGDPELIGTKEAEESIKKFRATKEESLDGSSRPEVGTKRLFTRFMPDMPFSIMSVKDLFDISMGFKGFWKGPIRKKVYNFMTNPQMLNFYKFRFIKKGLVPLASRGENGRMIFTSVDKDIESVSSNKDDLADYLWYELKDQGYWDIENSNEPEDIARREKIENHFKNIESKKNLDEAEQWMLRNVFDGNYVKYRQHWIARHNAFVRLFGTEYIYMKPSELMYRIKVPFTPVFTSPTLPDRKVMYFKTGGAKIRYYYEGKMVQERDLVQDLDGKMQYIGDGQTLTSEIVFVEEYPEHFGAHSNSKRAKTVHYNNDGRNNIHIGKHQEMTLDINRDETADIVDSDGNVIAVFKRDTNGNLNIYHPNDTTEGNHIHYLMSDDEAKTPELRKGSPYNEVVELPGKSVGMVLYTPNNMKTVSQFSAQLSYHFDDLGFQELLMKEFVLGEEHYFSPKNIWNRLLNYNKSAEGINGLISEFALKHFDVMPQNIEELGKLGAGRHPTTMSFLREVLRSKMLKPIADFKMRGTYGDFRADYRGRVSDDEVIIGSGKSLVNFVIEQMGAKKKVYNSWGHKLEEMNRWLANNNLRVMIVRHPVASSMGFGVYRVKEIDSKIGDSFIVSPKEVKERFEGDQDHDTGHIVFLTNDMANQLQSYQQKTRGLNLQRFERRERNPDIASLAWGIDLIREMTYGEKAIGEVANVGRFAGLLNQMMSVDDGFKFKDGAGNETEIKVRRLDDVVEDHDMRLKTGGHFKGTLRELLRIYLQAAVDHPKVLLLKDWNYTQAKLYSMVFYDTAQAHRNLDMESDGTVNADGVKIIRTLNAGFIKPILKINSKVDNQRDAVTGSINFKDIFDLSSDYHAFVLDRNGVVAQEMSGFKKRWEAKMANYGKDADYFENYMELSDVNISAGKYPISLQEMITVAFDQILTTSNTPRDRWFDVPHDVSSAVHPVAVKDITEMVLPEISNIDQDTNWRHALGYAQQMQNELYAMVNKMERTGRKEMPFIDKLNPKTWDYAPEFIEFFEKWSKIFDKLDPIQRKVATIAFLNGMVIESNVTGKRNSRKDLRMIPPIKEEGSTTLDPDIMSMYFERYNEVLDNIYSDKTLLKKYKKMGKFRSIKKLKKAFGCG